MSTQPDFERDLRTWLETDGPQNVPERLLGPAITEATAQRRKRPLPGPLIATIDAVESLAVRRDIPATRVWVAIGLLLALTIALGLAAGMTLLTVERLATNGAIGFVQGNDIWTYDPERDDAPVNWSSTIDLEESGPVWSPDGSQVAYWVTDPAEDTAWIEIRGWPHGPITRLRAADGLVLRPRDRIYGWSPDGTRLVASAVGFSGDGSAIVPRVVVVFDIEDGTVSRITGDEPASSFGWSPDGRHIGLLIGNTLALHDLVDGTTRSISDSLPAGTIGRAYVEPVFSADGNSVIFATAELYTDRSDIRSISIDGELGELAIADEPTELAVAVAPRGGRLAYARSDAASVGAATSGSGTDDIGGTIIVREPDGSEREVATGVWPVAAWAPDGERLVTRSVDGAELVVIDVVGGRDPIRVPIAGDDTIEAYGWGALPS